MLIAGDLNCEPEDLPHSMSLLEDWLDMDKEAAMWSLLMPY